MALPPESSASAIAGAIRRGETTALAQIGAALDRIAAVEPKLHAFIKVLPGRALARARDLDRLPASKKAALPLLGVPIAAKDNYCVQGAPATCGSKILEGFTAPYTATSIARLEAAGAVIIGKTNMDEFAMGSSTEFSAFGPSHNPWDLSRVPGGSSGGSAAAVAAGIAPLALGSDTGGSVKQPAAFCGLYGMRPSYGLISRHGLIAFASSLDTVAPFARSLDDLDLALATMLGPDGYDMTVQEYPASALSPAISLKGLKVGLLSSEGAAPEIVAALGEQVSRLKSAGAEIVPLELRSVAAALQTYYLIAPAECSSNLARFDGVRFGLRRGGEKGLESLYTATREAGFGAEVKRRILIGTFALSAGYKDAFFAKAQQARGLIAKEYADAFQKVDYLIGPTTPTTAFKLGEKTNDPMAMYLNDIYTIPSCLAGLPGLNIPAGMAKLGDGTQLPIGVQLIGPAGSDRSLIQFAKALTGNAIAPAARVAA